MFGFVKIKYFYHGGHGIVDSVVVIYIVFFAKTLICPITEMFWHPEYALFVKVDMSCIYVCVWL